MTKKTHNMYHSMLVIACLGLHGMFGFKDVLGLVFPTHAHLHRACGMFSEV